MVVVDSSVWIDFFNGRPGPEVDTLRRLLSEGVLRLVVPDLVLYEVLRGFRLEREFRQARSLLEGLSVEPASNAGIAREAAQHDRALRLMGHTMRRGIDVLVASFCIEHGYTLLHKDRDFLPFEQLRGLRAWRH